MSEIKANMYEICGVAGTGKSTTFRACTSEFEDALIGFNLSLRKHYWDIACALVTSVAPVILSGFKGLTFSRWKLIIYLNAMYRVLRREASENNPIRLLDQGPVYIQAYLLVSVRGYKPTRFIQNWVAKDIERWSRIIRGVILLKAANNVVLERINSRSQEHFIKRGSDEEASRFLGEYTSCYDKIFAIYRECGVPIKEVDTSSSGVDEVKASVVEFID